MKNEGLQHLEDVVKSVYLVEDKYIVKLLCALIISHRLNADPVWVFIVAPSGGCKTEYIHALLGIDNIYPISTLTSRTFISGQKRTDKEASLLFKINEGIIVFEDFTTLLNENRDERSAIMGQLRAIYGGKFIKHFGTGETMDWEGKITLIAGATFAIHTLRELYAAMGERFLMYNLIQPDEIEAARRAMENQASGQMREKRKEVADAFKNYIDNEFKMPEQTPAITAKLQQELLELAELATRARSTVEREWRSPGKEMTDVHPPEMPTRFAGQLQTMAKALMIINQHENIDKGQLTKDDKNILYKLTLDSITKSKRFVLQELAKYDIIETTALATKMNFPTQTIRRRLEDLNALKVIERVKNKGPRGDQWSLLPKYKTIIQKFENIKILAPILDMKEIADEEGGEYSEEELPPLE